jgi:hypothetical protein
MYTKKSLPEQRTPIMSQPNDFRRKFSENYLILFIQKKSPEDFR